ncbi:MAG TPA: gamma-glutamyltransferase [Gaiellaceae bacterium]
MQGAVAAGHPLTVEAGARVLEAGGNAVDACVAAAFASWVAEAPLTGPGGGGFMLVHTGRDCRTRVFDFFVAVPGSGRRGEPRPMETIDVVFEGSETQVFRIGEATVAVPGTALGLEAAHRAHGSLPWRDLVGRAVELAREGVELRPAQAYLHRILDAILRHRPESRAIFGADEPLGEGDRLVQRDLADTIERIGERGAAELYTGETGRAVAAHVQRSGGLVTSDDLAAYRVVRRRPVATEYRGQEFRSNPPPSSGGLLIAFGLERLERSDAPAGSAEAMVAIAEAMRAQSATRDGGFVAALYRGGLAKRLLAGTTHISVIDGNGDAASLSCSLGAGSGVVVPGTGVHLNNMLGEIGLRGSTRTGARMSSMMAPSVLVRNGRARVVVGSAGSLRLYGAIMQVVANVVGHGLGVEEAVSAPRVHLDGELLHCEGGADEAELDRLEELGWELVRWQRRNLYFGGVAAVEVLVDGTLAAAGDPRRGGAGAVVT